MNLYERGFSIPYVGRESQTQKRIDKIASGINWEEASFLRVPEKVQYEINSVIDDQLSRLKRYFLIVRPDVNIMQGWNEIPPEGERPMGEAIANAFVSNDIPQGLITLSPRFIRETATYKIQYRRRILIDLIGTLAHESDHLWQWNNDKDQLIEDLEVVNEEDGQAKWNETESEKQAVRFEDYWIRNWRKFPA